MRSYSKVAKVAIGIGAASLGAGGASIYLGLVKLRSRARFTDRSAFVMLGASLMWIGAAAIDGGTTILKEEGILK